MLICFRWHTISQRQNQFFIKSNILNQSTHGHTHGQQTNGAQLDLNMVKKKNCMRQHPPANGFEVISTKKKPNKIAVRLCSHRATQKIIYKQITATI